MRSTKLSYASNMQLVVYHGFEAGARLPAVVCSSPSYSNDVIAFEPQGCAVAVTMVTVDLALADDQPISRRAMHLIRFLSLNDVVVMVGVRAVVRFLTLVIRQLEHSARALQAQR